MVHSELSLKDKQDYLSFSLNAIHELLRRTDPVVWCVEPLQVPPVETPIILGDPVVVNSAPDFASAATASSEKTGALVSAFDGSSAEGTADTVKVTSIRTPAVQPPRSSVETPTADGTNSAYSESVRSVEHQSPALSGYIQRAFFASGDVFRRVEAFLNTMDQGLTPATAHLRLLGKLLTIDRSDWHAAVSVFVFARLLRSAVCSIR